MENFEKIILHLCGGTGADSKDYKDAGYDVRLITLPKYDVRVYFPPLNVYGVIANPPCTDLAASGARWWKQKGEKALFEAIAIVFACLKIIFVSEPKFWVIENPVGRLVHFLGKPKLYYHPCDYGDPYTKLTCLWGEFNIPQKRPVFPSEGSKIHKYPPSKDRAMLRSITPPGFAKAFFEANR